MQVDHTVAREFDQPRWDDFAICDNNDQFRFQRLKKQSRLVIFETRRLVHIEVQFQSLPLHRRSLKRLPAAAGFVRLRIDGDDRISLFEEALKRRNCKRGSPHENYSQALH